MLLASTDAKELRSTIYNILAIPSNWHLNNYFFIMKRETIAIDTTINVGAVRLVESVDLLGVRMD